MKQEAVLPYKKQTILFQYAYLMLIIITTIKTTTTTTTATTTTKTTKTTTTTATTITTTIINVKYMKQAVVLPRTKQIRLFQCAYHVLYLRLMYLIHYVAD